MKHIKTLVALGAAFAASSVFAASAGAANTDASGKRFIQIAEKDGKAAIRVNDDDAKGWTANNRVRPRTGLAGRVATDLGTVGKGRVAGGQPPRPIR